MNTQLELQLEEYNMADIDAADKVSYSYHNGLSMSEWIDIFNFNLENDVNNMQDKYSDFVMNNADPSEYNIHNGDSLLQATDSEYLLEDFMYYWIGKYNTI